MDFFHVTEYLAKVSVVMQKEEAKRQEWLSEACHDLKHKTKGAKLIVRELKEYQRQMGNKDCSEILESTITYFDNNIDRMNYAKYEKQDYPIGSGVTEAACKVLAKQRLSNSGMRWTIDAAQHMLMLRGLIYTEGRWQQFWKHIEKNGI